jgi:hypothetical protein
MSVFDDRVFDTFPQNDRRSQGTATWFCCRPTITDLAGDRVDHFDVLIEIFFAALIKLNADIMTRQRSSMSAMNAYAAIR